MNINIPYKTETLDKILVYHYDVHMWRYDCKYWLANGMWCTDIDGNNVVGKLNEKDLYDINAIQHIITEREIENKKYISWMKCRKRTCICKQCNKMCHCDGCNGKILDCARK